MVNVPIAAESLFTIGSWPVTNAMVNVWLAILFFLTIAFCLRRGLSERPGLFQNGIEMLIETILDFFDKVTNDRQRSRQFLPIAGTFFFFILFSNWLGLLPGTGSIGLWHFLHGELELVPVLRSANSDLNLTVAMALISVIGSHLLGIFSIGFFTHLNKFIQLGTIWVALKTLNPLTILIACVEFMVGIIEIFSECAKILSLSLRLFGNIFAGEVLITVIGSLISVIVPVPFLLLEIIVGIVQAMVFSLLTVVYLTMSTTAPHGSHDKQEDTTPQNHTTDLDLHGSHA